MMKDPSSAPPTMCPMRDHTGQASPEEHFDLNPCNKTAAVVQSSQQEPTSGHGAALQAGTLTDSALSRRSLKHPNHHRHNQWQLSHLSTEKKKLSTEILIHDGYNLNCRDAEVLTSCWAVASLSLMDGDRVQMDM